MPVSFRPMRAEDKELFTNLLRSLPSKDNYYLWWTCKTIEPSSVGWRGFPARKSAWLRQRAARWSAIAILQLMIPPWISAMSRNSHERFSSPSRRGHRPNSRWEDFRIARARGMQKLWVRMAISQAAAQVVFQNLGFRYRESLLPDFVKNENGSTEKLPSSCRMIAGSFGRSKRRPVVPAQKVIERGATRSYRGGDHANNGSTGRRFCSCILPDKLKHWSYKPTEEEAAKAKALINSLMQDRFFLALYRSNDPSARRRNG